MGRRPRILTELGITQQRYILDPIQRGTMQVFREALVAKHGEAFLQRQLKPVTAGDAVARPVMEILMGNHALNPFQLGIGGGFSIGQHQLGVEDIEALVLHGAHIEMAHRHDVVFIEVVLQAVALLVPSHGAPE